MQRPLFSRRPPPSPPPLSPSLSSFLTQPHNQQHYNPEHNKKTNQDVDGINLFGMISIASLLFCAPAAIFVEGGKWAAAWQAATAGAAGAGPLLSVLAWGGLFYHLYNQASYMVLDQGITPVTFSVANTMKRVAVVVSAVAFFRNPVSPLNWVGSGVAILGTYLYTAATDRQKAEEAARRKAA
jgi:solute carrier family 35 protein E1